MDVSTSVDYSIYEEANPQREQMALKEAMLAMAELIQPGVIVRSASISITLAGKEIPVDGSADDS